MGIYNFFIKLYRLFMEIKNNEDSNEWHHTHKKGDTQFFDITTKQIRSIHTL